MSFRISSELHEKLIAASNKNERSLSEEIEKRLEDSFNEPEVIFKTAKESIEYIVSSITKTHIEKMGGIDGFVAGEMFGQAFESCVKEADNIFHSSNVWYFDDVKIGYIENRMRSLGVEVMRSVAHRERETHPRQPTLEEIAMNVGVDISGLDPEGAMDKIVDHIRRQQENSGNK